MENKDFVLFFCFVIVLVMYVPASNFGFHALTGGQALGQNIVVLSFYIGAIAFIRKLVIHLRKKFLNKDKES